MKTVYFTFCLIFLLMLNSCCKSELDFIKNNRKNYISDNLSNENNLSSSSFEFYKLFGEDYLKQYLYKNDSIPLNFCNNSKDSISVEFKKNPISVEDNNLEIII
ncbi:MAG: hypothetical protein MUE53_05975, partial [Chitinophagales bacterium]|nr:hypothetical protein [Chitinophagales bacterium]